MANIVDELVVKLGLDPKEFEKGSKVVIVQLEKVKDKSEEAEKKLKSSGKKGSAFFTELQKSALKFFSVMAIGTASVRAFTNLIASGAHLSRLATNLGTSANSLHKWGQAVKQSGGTAQGFEATIRGLSAEITAWKTGGTAGPMLQGLQALGVSLVDTGGKAKSLETLLLDMGEAVQRRAPNRADQANLLAQWGLDEGTINLVLKRRKDAEALIASQPGMDDKAAKKAQDINERWLALVEQVRGKFRELAIQHFPAIERIVLALVGAFERMSPIVTTIVEGFTKLNDLTDGWLGKVLIALGAFKLLKGALPGMPGGDAPGKAPGKGPGGSPGLLAGLLTNPYVAAITGSLLQKGSTAPDQQEASALMAKVRQGDRDAAMQLAKIQLNNQFWRFGKPASESEIKKRAADLLSNAGQGQSMSGKVTLNQALGKKSNISDELKAKLDAADKAAGLPTGMMSSILQQEIGKRKEFLEDPSKYHYDVGSDGLRRDSKGTISNAFGPFGLLDSTAKQPGFGVAPLKDKSLDEQIRFASQYLAGRIKHAKGDIFAGVGGYGEGAAYASQVLGRLPGGGMSGIHNAAAATTSTTQNITIGKIDIQTAATDAAGVARSLRDSLVREMNYGTR